MKLGFMTLGCPDWDLDTICRNGQAWGFDGVDFRGLGPEIDVTKLPAFTTDAAKTARRLADAGLAVSGISSSIKVCDASRRDANLDEAKRTIEAAAAVGAANVRVFGGGDAAKVGHRTAAAVGRECVDTILDLSGARKLSWNFETHDDWVRGADCKLLLDAIKDPAFGALWDLGHTKRVGGESPADTLAALGGRVRYTHVKDAVRDATQKGGWRYVMPGEGELPLAEAVDRLRADGYDGWLVFEHEKRWHPELEDPSVAFPAFAKWARATLARAVTRGGR
jgi:sugar phosphate isomerase/epimerase